jgi:hypothetical protein
MAQAPISPFNACRFASRCHPWHKHRYSDSSRHIHVKALPASSSVAWLPDEGKSGHYWYLAVRLSYASAGQVSLLDVAAAFQREISDGSEIMEFVLVLLELRSGLAQFLVLEFQLGLMDLQFMDQPAIVAAGS